MIAKRLNEAKIKAGDYLFDRFDQMIIDQAMRSSMDDHGATKGNTNDKKLGIHKVDPRIDDQDYMLNYISDKIVKLC